MLHGDNPAKDQETAVELKGFKIILATNIAETGITVKGILYVVDTGISKDNVNHPELRRKSLIPRPKLKPNNVDVEWNVHLRETSSGCTLRRFTRALPHSRQFRR